MWCSQSLPDWPTETLRRDTGVLLVWKSSRKLINMAMQCGRALCKSGCGPTYSSRILPLIPDLDSLFSEVIVKDDIFPQIYIVLFWKFLGYLNISGLTASKADALCISREQRPFLLPASCLGGHKTSVSYRGPLMIRWLSPIKCFCKSAMREEYLISIRFSCYCSSCGTPPEHLIKSRFSF